MARDKKTTPEVESKSDNKTLRNPTGIDVLDSVLLKLSKTNSADYSSDDFGNCKFTTSGSIKLDAALARGGICNGRLIEIIGESGSLKTSLALVFIAQRQAYRKANGITGKVDVILDLEYMLERDFIEGFGIDMSQIIWKRFETAEDALNFLITVLPTNAIDYVMVDSVDAMQTEQQLRKEVGEADVGGASKILSKAIRTLTKLAPIHDATIIFINQIRLNPGQMFGSPEVTPGGKALGFYTRLRIKMLPRKDGHPDVPGAAQMRLRILKTSFGPPVPEEIELAFVYGRGFDLIYDIESFAKTLGVLRHSAGQSKVQWTSDTDFVPLLPNIGKGKEMAQIALREHPILLERLRNTCLRIANVDTALPDKTFSDCAIFQTETASDESN